MELHRTAILAALGLAVGCAAISSAKGAPDRADTNLVAHAMAIAIQSVADGGPLVPFVMMQRSDGTVSLDRYVVGPTGHIDLAASADKALAALETCAGVRCVATIQGRHHADGKPVMLGALVVTKPRYRAFSYSQDFIAAHGHAKARARGPLLYLGPP